MDRLGRTVPELSKLFEELLARNIALVSLRDGLDLSTPAGRLMAHILVSISAYELEVRSERQLAGIAAVRKANGGKCPWGGRKKGDRIKVTQEVQRAIFDMLGAGKSLSGTARLLGLSRMTVYRVLKAA